jgi:hypothetical protein
MNFTHIIIICHLSGLRNRLDKNMYILFDYIKTHSNFKIVLCESSDTECENIENIIQNNKTIIVVNSCGLPNTLHTLIFEKYKSMCLSIYILEDICCFCNYKCIGINHKCKSISQRIESNKFDHVFYKFHTYITEYHFKPPVHFKFPFYISESESCQSSTNIDKKWDILFYGNTLPKVYPLRNRLYRLFSKNMHLFKIKLIPSTKKDRIGGKDLQLLISQSWLSIATKSIQNDLLAKYYEIPMYGSVLCGDYPDIETEQNIKQNMIYIDNSMSDVEILNIIKLALDDKEKLIEMQNKGTEYIKNNYSLSNGVKHFDTLINRVCEMHKSDQA